MKKHFYSKQKKYRFKTTASREYHLEKGKRLTKKIYFWTSFLLTAGLFYFFFYSNFFAFKTMEIIREEGIGQKISDEQIKNYIFSVFSKNGFLIFPQNNFFVFRKKTAENALKENLNLDKVSIKKYPFKLKIIMEEKTPAANLALLEKNFNEPESNLNGTSSVARNIKYRYYLIDKRGDILEEIKEINPRLPLIYNEKELPQYPYLTKEKLSFILDLFQKFSQRTKAIEILSFGVGDNKESKLTVVTSENWKIYFDFNEDIRKQLDKLFLILEEKVRSQKNNLEYLDLRFEDRIYYK